MDTPRRFAAIRRLLRCQTEANRSGDKCAAVPNRDASSTDTAAIRNASAIWGDKWAWGTLAPVRSPAFGFVAVRWRGCVLESDRCYRHFDLAGSRGGEADFTSGIPRTMQQSGPKEQDS